MAMLVIQSPSIHYISQFVEEQDQLLNAKELATLVDEEVVIFCCFHL